MIWFVLIPVCVVAWFACGFAALWIHLFTISLNTTLKEYYSDAGKEYYSDAGVLPLADLIRINFIFGAIALFVSVIIFIKSLFEGCTERLAAYILK